MGILLHLPVNHRFRGLYRFLAFLTGLYVLVFGITGALASRGHSAFSRDHIVALGLRTNLAFGVLSIVVGLLVLAGLVIGRNVDHVLNLVAGLAFLVVGMFMLGLLNTTLNVLNYSVATCVVSFVVGLVLFTAGSYSRTGDEQPHQAPDHADQAGRQRPVPLTAPGG
jgi:uncharacterized membrane protein YczE